MRNLEWLHKVLDVVPTTTKCGSTEMYKSLKNALPTQELATIAQIASAIQEAAHLLSTLIIMDSAKIAGTPIEQAMTN